MIVRCLESPGGARAGCRSGTSVEEMAQDSCTTAACSIKATRRSRPPQRGHARTSSPNHWTTSIASRTLHQIPVKRPRGLSSRRDGRMGRSDANGSAKVALIGIDRSLAAWRVLQQWCADTNTPGVVVDTLTELRAGIEGEFPRARAFKRPGFDRGRVVAGRPGRAAFLR